MEASGASKKSLSQAVRIYLRWARQNLKILDGEELSCLIGVRELIFEADELVELFLLASRIEARCASHVASLTAQSIKGPPFPESIFWTQLLSTEVCETSLALELSEGEVAIVVGRCGEGGMGHAVALVDRWLTCSAEMGRLKIETFLALAQLPCLAMRRSHDGLWPPLRYLLQNNLVRGVGRSGDFVDTVGIAGHGERREKEVVWCD